MIHEIFPLQTLLFVSHLVVVLPLLVASHKVADLYLDGILQLGPGHIETEVVLVHYLIQVSVVKFLNREMNR